VYVKLPYAPERKLKVGEFIEVTVTAADAHDLWAHAD
jgi:ribosomal protein S12 methylthiotransferase